MSYDPSHVLHGRGGDGRAHLTRQFLPELAAHGCGGGGMCPQTSPLLMDLLKRGGKGGDRKQSLEGIMSTYCIYFSVLYSCKESRATILT